MDPVDRTISLETFTSWKLTALKDFLSRRGLSTDGTKTELAALCFASNAMKLPLKVSECEYADQLKKEYNDLLCVEGKILPDPLKIGGGWQDEKCGMSQWPPLFLSDIVNFFLDKGASNTVKTYLSDYKVGKAFEYCQSDFIKEIFYHPISSSSTLCFLRAKCTPSQRLQEDSHTLWVAISKESGCVKAAFCSCTAGMGQTCNHVAALMFRVESANKLGLTSCTSLPCQWKVPSSTTEMIPVKIKDLSVRKSRHGQEKTRPLVSKQKYQYKPQESVNLDRDSFIDELRKAVPNACLLKGTDLPVVEEVHHVEGNNSKEVVEHFIISNIAKDVHTVEDFIINQPTLTPSEVEDIQKETVGQSENKSWHAIRKDRITASNMYAVHTRMNSYKKNPEIDLSNVISLVMGRAPINSNIKALKFGRESEPLAKSIYCKMYVEGHVNANFRECGIFLDQDVSFLAASPDMLVSCDCCGEGLLEVKSTMQPKCSSCSSFCICILPDYICTSDNGELEIKKNHKYFCQIQGQMAISKRMWCDFFVYSCNGSFLRRFIFQEDYYANVQSNLIDFFKTVIAPKCIEEKMCASSCIVCPDKVSEECEPMEVESGGGDVYFCLLCNNQIQEQENVKSFGQRSICCDMCDNWFHFKCIGMSKSVLNCTSTWLCQTCSSLP